VWSVVASSVCPVGVKRYKDIKSKKIMMCVFLFFFHSATTTGHQLTTLTTLTTLLLFFIIIYLFLTKIDKKKVKSRKYKVW
jgi:uncharacterized membrane protein YfhO